MRRLGIVLAAALVTATCSDPSDDSVRETDLLVVGSGISGLSAALEAARAGATVRVVEMSSVFGGHAVMAHGGLSLVGTPVQEAAGVEDTPEIAARDFLEWGEDANDAWVSRYVSESDERVYDWLTELGVVFSDRLIQIPGNRVPRFHSPEGRGLGLVAPIFRACLRQPIIHFEWNTRVDGLVRENDRIVGVEAVRLRSEEAVEFRAARTILATGGFQSNLDMVREFWPDAHAFPERILVGSGVHSIGSGHRVAEDAGAALMNMDRQWNYATGLPDPRYPGSDRGLNAHNGAGLWVNAQARRFVNETSSTKERFRALLEQRPARFWLIFDTKGKRRLFVSGSDWADAGTVDRQILQNSEITHRASSIVELARMAGLQEGELTATIGRYNSQVATGDDPDFRRFGYGGVPYDLAPFAEEGPIPIDTPPYYALTLFPLARKSMGGVAIDTAGRALDGDGEPIPGLYAVGELAGFGGVNGWAGLEGTFLGPSVLTGRVAARHAVEDLAIAPPLIAAAEEVAEPAQTRATFGNEACTGCHDLDRWLSESRPGYWHFEATHAVVLERELECRSCHSEMFPFRVGLHLRDADNLSRSCAQCHLAREH